MASRSWNRVELIGNLTRDPELRYTPSGAAVCTFGVATNRTYVSEGERKEEVDFHRCVSWNKLAELCNQLLKKGNKVFISGRLQTRSWEAADGQTRTVTEIVVEDMIVLTPRSNGGPISNENLDVPMPEEKAEEPEPDVGLSPKKEEKKSSSAKATVADAPELQRRSEDKGEKAKVAPQEDVKDDEDLPF